MTPIRLTSLLAVAAARRVTTALGGRSNPTTLVTNNAQDSALVTFTWSNGATRTATVRAGDFGCVVYTVLADSGRFTVTFPTPSGVNAGHGAVTLGPSAWFKIDSTAGAFSFHGPSLPGPDLAMVITEAINGAYAYALGSAQACGS
jgi:hypothetical protein